MNIAARTAADTEAMASPVGEEDFRLAVLNAVLVSDQRFQGPITAIDARVPVDRPAPQIALRGGRAGPQIETNGAPNPKGAVEAVGPFPCGYSEAAVDSISFPRSRRS